MNISQHSKHWCAFLFFLRLPGSLRFDFQVGVGGDGAEKGGKAKANEASSETGEANADGGGPGCAPQAVAGWISMQVSFEERVALRAACRATGLRGLPAGAMSAQETAAAAGEGAAVRFSAKDLQVDWDKVNRVVPLVEQALGSKRGEAGVVATARRLEKFYPHLVRWDITRSKSGVSAKHIMELFRLSQVVLEAREMESREVKAELAGELAELKQRLARRSLPGPGRSRTRARCMKMWSRRHRPARSGADADPSLGMHLPCRGREGGRAGGAPRG